MSDSKQGERRRFRDALHERPAEQVLHEGPHDRTPGSPALFDVNSASEEEIAFVEMIGPADAHVIVEQRERRGGFQSWEELAEAAGLTAKKVAELQRAARLTPPLR